MNTYRKRFFDNAYTTRTFLACAVWIDFYYLTIGASSLIREKVPKSTPSGIGYAFTQVFVFDHIFDFQFFNCNQIKVFNIMICSFVQKVRSLICGFLMIFGNQFSCFFTGCRTFFASGQLPLFSSELLFCFTKMLGIVNLITIGICKKATESNIDAYLFIGNRQRVFRDIVTRKGDEPFSSRRSFDGNSFDTTLNWPGEEKFKSTNIFNIQIFAIKLPARLSKRKGFEAGSWFESWESRLFALFQSAKKTFECFIKRNKNILQTLRIDSFEIRKNLFEYG